MMELPVCPAFSRSSKGLKGTKTAAALVALVKVAAEKPAKATALRAPGVSRAMSETRRTTASVRDSDAPSGSCTTTIA